MAFNILVNVRPVSSNSVIPEEHVEVCSQHFRTQQKMTTFRQRTNSVEPSTHARYAPIPIISPVTFRVNEHSHCDIRCAVLSVKFSDLQ